MHAISEHESASSKLIVALTHKLVSVSAVSLGCTGTLDLDCMAI